MAALGSAIGQHVDRGRCRGSGACVVRADRRHLWRSEPGYASPARRCRREPAPRRRRRRARPSDAGGPGPRRPSRPAAREGPRAGGRSRRSRPDAPAGRAARPGRARRPPPRPRRRYDTLLRVAVTWTTNPLAGQSVTDGHHAALMAGEAASAFGGLAQRQLDALPDLKPRSAPVVDRRQPGRSGRSAAGRNRAGHGGGGVAARGGRGACRHCLAVLIGRGQDIRNGRHHHPWGEQQSALEPQRVLVVQRLLPPAPDDVLGDVDGHDVARRGPADVAHVVDHGLGDLPVRRGDHLQRHRDVAFLPLGHQSFGVLGFDVDGDGLEIGRP